MLSPTQSGQASRADLSGGTGDRIVSLDALRGFDMFWIIGGDLLVRSFPRIHDSNWTRGLAAQMEHCAWAGFHFYDLIFPLFVFIVGASLVYSLSRSLERRGRAATLRRIVLRSVVLFVLGIIYMGGVAEGFRNVYLAGVLHRIAGAYFFAALIFCFCDLRATVGICAALLVGYWALMTFLPVPGIGSPDLTVPGRNLAHYIDQLYLPGQKFEGTLLSTMAAVANCLLGVFAGRLLQDQRVAPTKKVFWLLVAGLVALTLGLVWARQFPIIKLLWTSSYVLVACGCSAILLASFYLVIDIWKVQAWALPFRWIGLNALTIYVVANFVHLRRLAARFVGGDISLALGRFGDLATALVCIALVLWLARFLWRRAIFLRL